jgi:hypothetical protein
MDFDGEDLVRQLGQDGGVLAEPGADLEHPVALLDAEQIGHELSATMKGWETVLPQPMGIGRSA